MMTLQLPMVRPFTGAIRRLIGRARPGWLADLAEKHCRAWAEIATSTQPADRDLADWTIRRLYAHVGLGPPQMIWTEGPLESLSMCADLRKANPMGFVFPFDTLPLKGTRWDETFYDDPRFWNILHRLEAIPGLGRSATQMEYALQRAVETLVGAPTWDFVLRDVWGSCSYRRFMLDEYRGRKAFNVEHAEKGMTLCQWRSPEWVSIGTCFHGARDVPHLAAWEFAVDTLGLDSPHNKSVEVFELWRTLAKAGGWWWPFESHVIASDRPSAVQSLAGGTGADSRWIFRDGWSYTPVRNDGVLEDFPFVSWLD